RFIGGVAVVHRAPDIETLENRDDVALLWDLRVAPDARHAGVGRALMDAVDAWARSHEASWLEVETQNINAPACRFYAANGFELREAHIGAYPGLPNEIQLLWYKPLSLRVPRGFSNPSA
ncbi:MAG TPA: GNAT family N-acetyltransferase, partial [Gemmatimonadaceae bacterium]|nr:GNAT family N-acetyltransferase [Gemmatimonadaceae bacterium]